MFVIGASFISRLKAAAIRCQLPGQINKIPSLVPILLLIISTLKELHNGSGWKHGSNRLHVQGMFLSNTAIIRDHSWRQAISRKYWFMKRLKYLKRSRHDLKSWWSWNSSDKQKQWVPAGSVTKWSRCLFFFLMFSGSAWSPSTSYYKELGYFFWLVRIFI